MGGRVTTVAEFLDLSEEDQAYIEMRLALAVHRIATRLPLVLAISLGPAARAALAVQGTREAACLPGVGDLASPGDCIPASSVPTLRALFPLGPIFHIEPTGEVGIWNTSPQHTLDVGGDARFTGRMAFGNDATVGAGASAWERHFDFSHTIEDFSASSLWVPLYSWITLDPQQDLTGPDAKYVYGTRLITQIPATNPHDVEFHYAMLLDNLKAGSGTSNIMAGAFLGAFSTGGHVKKQYGVFLSSAGGQDATITDNYAAHVTSGLFTPGSGSIENDYSLYVSTPGVAGPLANHYGVFIENQDVGEAASYALYSAGDVGIGEPVPAAALHVDGDFVATGVKSLPRQRGAAREGRLRGAARASARSPPSAAPARRPLCTASSRLAADVRTELSCARCSARSSSRSSQASRRPTTSRSGSSDWPRRRRPSATARSAGSRATCGAPTSPTSPRRCARAGSRFACG